MGWISVLLGLLVAGLIATAIPRTGRQDFRIALVVCALLALGLGVALSSVRYVGEQSVGVVIRNAFGPSLPPGKIIATEGEMGPQAEILAPGWHFGYWPGIFDIESAPVLTIEKGKVGLLTALDGQPLRDGQVYAPEWDDELRGRMLDATYFLGMGGGYKGPQASVLTPGKWRINPRLFQVQEVEVTNVPQATVGVIKSNIGVGATPGAAGAVEAGSERLVNQGERGIRRTPLNPGEYYLNTNAYEVTLISTKESIIEFTKSRSGDGMEREITERTSDGFEFPVDVRVVYKIEPDDAPIVVARLRDDREGLRDILQSAVRAIFRNNAQDVKALDYVQQRSQQEVRSTEMLAKEMRQYGVTISAVRINDLGDDSERWQALLKTQTDREIALQEQETFREQQRAAEQKKELTRTEQEAEEERRLATATYEVKIAQEQKQRRVIEAGAEAEATLIKAEAEAEAYRMIATQIGPANAALMELMRIVGESGINITPRVMVTSQPAPDGSAGVGAGGSGGSADAQVTALIGTMLDSMLSREPVPAESTRPMRPSPGASSPDRAGGGYGAAGRTP
ncbi:MAG: SPFH domain-containing protein [Phycisphaerales bacterium]